MVVAQQSKLTAPISVGAAVDPTHAVQLQQMTGGGTTTADYVRLFINVVDITAPVELNAYNGKNAGVIDCRQEHSPTDLYCSYRFDGDSTANPNGQTVVDALSDADYPNPVWVAHGPYNVLGEINQEGNHVAIADDVYDIGRVAGGNKRWKNGFFSGAVSVGANASTALQLVPLQQLSSRIQVVAVASLANPASEFSALTGTVGGLILAYQATGSANDNWSLYGVDASAGATNVPYVVALASPNKAIAIGGRYFNGLVSFNAVATFLGSVVMSSSLTVTGTLTAQGAIDAQGVLTVASYLNLTAQPNVQAFFSGSVTIATGTNTAITWTENHDKGGNFSAGVFTAPVDGVYAFAASAQMDIGGGAANERTINMLMLKNVSTQVGSFPGVTNLTKGYTSGATHMVSLVLGDTLTPVVRQDTGVNCTLTGATVTIWKAG